MRYNNSVVIIIPSEPHEMDLHFVNKSYSLNYWKASALKSKDHMTLSRAVSYITFEKCYNNCIVIIIPPDPQEIGLHSSIK